MAEQKLHFVPGVKAAAPPAAPARAVRRAGVVKADAPAVASAAPPAPVPGAKAPRARQRRALLIVILLVIAVVYSCVLRVTP